MHRVTIVGVPVDVCTMAEAVETVATLASGSAPTTRDPATDLTGCAQVFFLNAHCGNVAARDVEYHRILNAADYVFADGAGVKIAGRIRKTPITENVNGTDMFPLLLDQLERTGARVFFVGAKRRVIAALVPAVARRWPQLRITGWTSGYFDDHDEVVQTVRFFGADVLFVAMGVPRQEKWIARYAGATGARVALAVGGLFDFYSGTMPRAPRWLRLLGMEWLFRLIQEPGRMWRRYLIGNLAFLARVVWGRNPPFTKDSR